MCTGRRANTHANIHVWQVEKSLLKTKVDGDVSGVKDIVRAMAIVSQMVHVAQLLRLLRQMQEELRRLGFDSRRRAGEA